MPRKPKFQLTPEQIKQVETMSGLGLNLVQMGALFGVSKVTFERLMKKNIAAREALEKGRAVAASSVTKTAYNLAVSGKVPAMTMFWLKCRERWTEIQRHEHSGPDGNPIETVDKSTLTNEQLEAKIAAMLEKRKKP